MKHFKISKVAGFSLVELMVSVGIVGILATVAVPQYQKFTNRAKQVEAKTSLGAAYTVEKAFFIEAGGYISCLKQIGFGIDTSASRAYAVGSVGGTFNRGTITCTNGADTSYFISGLSGGTAMTVTDLAGTFANDTGFNIGAAGKPNGFSGTDKWSMDQDQNLKNTQSGI